jgi:hypothetical protein
MSFTLSSRCLFAALPFSKSGRYDALAMWRNERGDKRGLREAMLHSCAGAFELDADRNRTEFAYDQNGPSNKRGLREGGRQLEGQLQETSEARELNKRSKSPPAPRAGRAAH